MPYLIAALGGILAFCVVSLLLRRVLGGRIAMGERIGRLVRSASKAGADVVLPKRRERNRRFRAGGKIRSQLEAAGIMLRAEEFILIWALAAVGPAGLVLFFVGSPITAIGLAAAGAAIPPVVVSAARKRRLTLFEKQLGDALGIISNCLRAGFTFQQAMESIAGEMAEPISREFGKTLREIKLGVPIETAMENFERRMGNEDLGMIVSAVLIQRQVGGNLADIIDNVSVTIRDRLKIKGDVKVLSASGRISGIVIGLLPVFLLGVLTVINPTYIQSFFDTTAGIVMLCVAGFLEVTGFLFVQKIVNIKF